MKNTIIGKKLVFAFTLSFLIFSFTSFAQEKIKAFEISTSTFDQFTLRYKFGNEKHLYRISSLALYDKSTELEDYEERINYLKVGIGFGVEFPKQINDKLSLYFGPECRGSIRNLKYESDNRLVYGISLIGILGFAYHFNNTIRLGAEILPGFGYYHNNDEDQSFENSFQFDFSNHPAEIVLGFYF